MSGKLMGRVYDIRLPHDEQAIMVALADHGSDFGEHIHPSVDYLAWKTGYDRRNVQRILRKLERKQLLIPVAFALGGRGLATEYEMHLENGEQKPPFERRVKGGTQTTLSDDYDVEKGGAGTAVSEPKGGTQTTLSENDTKGRHLIHKRAASHTQRAASHTQKGGTHAAPTVIEPSYEPSEEPAHTREKKNERAEPDPEPETPPVAGRPPYDDRAFRRWALSQTGGWTNLSPKRLDMMMDRYCREKGILV